jgi:hypothetical protein
MARQAISRTSDVSGEKTGQWPDIAEVPASDQCQPAASFPSHEVSISEKTTGSRASRRRDDVIVMVRHLLLTLGACARVTVVVLCAVCLLNNYHDHIPHL